MNAESILDSVLKFAEDSLYTEELSPGLNAKYCKKMFYVMKKKKTFFPKEEVYLTSCDEMIPLDKVEKLLEEIGKIHVDAVFPSWIVLLNSHSPISDNYLTYSNGKSFVHFIMVDETHTVHMDMDFYYSGDKIGERSDEKNC
jgi:hypothetical protein